MIIYCIWDLMSIVACHNNGKQKLKNISNWVVFWPWIESFRFAECLGNATLTNSIEMWIQLVSIVKWMVVQKLTLLSKLRFGIFGLKFPEEFKLATAGDLLGVEGRWMLLVSVGYSTVLHLIPWMAIMPEVLNFMSSDSTRSKRLSCNLICAMGWAKIPPKFLRKSFQN